MKRVDPIIETVLKERHLPGVGVGVVYEGEMVYARGFGQANIEQNVPVTPDTVFRIASISKTVAAVGLMQLWERGKFDLQDPINDYLTSYKVCHPHWNAPPITFHHLLTHTAGIGEFARLYKYLSPQAHFNVVRPNQPVPPLNKLYGRTLHAECFPGEKWCYANNGYATVGQLIADISNQPFPDYIRQHILAPLGMDNSEFWRSERVRDGLAIGYSYKARQKRFKPVIDLEQVTTAAGAMYATVNDMGRYVAALMGKGVAILKPETMALMFTPQYQLDERLPGMGYGFFVDAWQGHRVVSHDGQWLGFNASLFMAPEAELGIVALTNTANTAVTSLARILLQHMLPPAKSARKKQSSDAPNVWPELAGHYAPAPGFNTNFRLWLQYGGELEVYRGEKGLEVRSLRGGWKQGQALNRGDADDPLSFTVGNRAVIFKRNEAGEPDRLLLGLNAFWKRPYRRSIRFRLKLLPIAVLIFLIAIYLLAFVK